ncbi:MAG TPA: GYD domain-containing protein [Burkholderiales bacterium]|nr:GYD domain-containing protein [Burkholderiales bacterium]
MAYYMIQTAFTADAWGTMLKNPQNRAEQVRPMIEKLGGKLEGYWSCFGDYDTVLIVQAPDNVAAAALSLAAAGGGALRSAKTTPLMTMDETVQALKRAGKAGYKIPG